MSNHPSITPQRDTGATARIGLPRVANEADLASLSAIHASFFSIGMIQLARAFARVFIMPDAVVCVLFEMPLLRSINTRIATGNAAPGT